jgi:hypothetical protein
MESNVTIPTAETLPPVTERLVTGLEELFPNTRPELSETDREVWFKAGQVSVVQFLRDVHERQKESHLGA